MTAKKMTVREAKGRAKHADFLLTASCALRGYGRPELADELAALAVQIKDGTLPFDVEAAMA